MFVRTILFASIALMAGSASVASSQQEAGVAQVRRLDSLWARMYAKHDTALAFQLYAADLVFTSANGAQKTRAQ